MTDAKYGRTGWHDYPTRPQFEIRKEKIDEKKDINLTYFRFDGDFAAHFAGGGVQSARQVRDA